jgi:hypothetical protein
MYPYETQIFNRFVFMCYIRDLSYSGFNSPQVPTWLSDFNQLQTL